MRKIFLTFISIWALFWPCVSFFQQKEIMSLKLSNSNVGLLLLTSSNFEERSKRDSAVRAMLKTYQIYDIKDRKSARVIFNFIERNPKYSEELDKAVVHYINDVIELWDGESLGFPDQW